MRLSDVCTIRPTPRAPASNRSISSASRRRRGARLTALLPLRLGLSRSPCPSVRAIRPACAGRMLFRGGEGRALPVPSASSRSREQRSSRAAFSAAPRASETASDIPCRVRHRDAGHRGPPSPSSRQGGRLFDPGAPSAGERSRVRRLLQSRTIHEHGRESAEPRAGRLEVALAPDCPGGAASHEASPAALARLRGVGRSLGRAPPPTRRTRWDYPKTDEPEHPRRPLVARPAGEADLAGALLPFYDRARAPLTRGAPEGFAFARPSREAGSTRSSAKRSAVSPSPGCFRNEGTSPAFRRLFVHRLLPTCGWITSVAVRVARRLW